MSIQHTINPEKALKTRAMAERPLVWVGKNGLTGEIIAQVDTFLKKNKLVKIKLLPSFIEEHDRKEAAKELAEKTGSKLVYQTGFVVALYRR
jgi:putative YhbY family RNA-binding protein